ncbi:MAG: DMT family transporter [Coriobacteriales bacterium]|jgi:drug/metabolite transporter (DMT)-like permease|nr:DMT family transporter [Coriobacteriales bacterium]
MPRDTSHIPRKHKVGAIFLLMLTAFIWGTAFVAQRSGMEFVGPFLFNGVRNVLGALTLILVLAIMFLVSKAWGAVRGRGERATSPLRKATKEASTTSTIKTTNWRTIIVGGLVCGCVLFVASNLQQIGLVTTSASKSAFITTLYIVLVPLIGIAFMHRTHWNTWISVGIAVVGLYLLCITESLTITSGDFILILGAVFWALHILFIDRFVPNLGQREVLKLCIAQFTVTAVLSLICAPFFDELIIDGPSKLSALHNVLPHLAYTGVLSSGVAFTLAAIGQKYAPPAPASIVMSMESVFGVLGGVALLHEVLSGREVLGCVLMFIAVILAQLSFKSKKKKAPRLGAPPKGSTSEQANLPPDIPPDL